MKILLLVTGGRGGSDFFQGLLDEHDEISQFPGILRPTNNFKKIFDSRNPIKISNQFIKYAPYFFDSSQNSHERLNRLGKNKNQYYTVSKQKFINNFKNLYSYKNLNNLEILKMLHKAYYLACGKKIKKIKILFIHTHTIDMTIQFLKIVKLTNYSIIHTMRNPIEALYSPIKNWLKFKDGKTFFSKDLFFQIDLALNGISDLLKINKKTYIVLLENLINKRSKVMRDFCKIFKIKFTNKLLNCTYFGLQWWGDKVSGRWIGKSNRKFKSKNLNLEKYFFSRDITYFKSLSYDISKKYYNKKYYLPDNKKINENVLPIKAEILVWKNSFKHKRIKHILSIPYFYLKRVIFINKFFIKNNHFPYSIGTK